MNKGKISGSLRTHLLWPVILIPFLAIMTIHLLIADFKTGLISAVYVICYTAIALFLYNFNKKTVMANLINYAIAYNEFTKLMVKELDIPYATLDAGGSIMWYNDAFSALTGESAIIPEHISSVFPEIKPGLFPLTPSESSEGGDTDRELTFSYGDMYLRAVLRQTSIHDYDFSDDMENISLFENSDTFVTLYLYDETRLKEYAGRIRDEDIVMGLLYIDDYDEVLANCDELTRSLLMALVERQIAKNMQELDGIYRKMEKDRYFFIFRNKYLNIIKENKFSILDDVRNVKLGGNDDIRITISIGIGVHADSYAKRYEFARTAIDLALGRGGDQAVIKDGEKIIYYGGSNIQKESNTRVRARVKAHALNELIVAAEQIFIMGHKNCDADSFGASVGIYRIARALERTAQIIIEPGESSAISRFIDRYNENSYYDNFIISPEEARYKMTPDTLLIVTDVNKVSLVQCPPLLEQTRNLVVIDHHRQTDERIKNPVLSYIEPYASSASEMVTEFFRYINDGIRPRPLEADTLYSGIMVDTNNFSAQVGVRTFEAVAYLKRCGADITRIHKLFRSDPEEYMIRARAISNANIFLDSFVITTIPGTGNTPVIGAKVANSLLEMKGIRASFVLSEYKSRIYINARSIDEVNVQLIMEKLGGGGHVSAAAAQLDTNLDAAIGRLKDTISTMLKEGDIK